MQHVSDCMTKLGNKATAESALRELSGIFEDPANAPFAVKALPLILEKCGDKAKPVVKAATETVKAACTCAGSHALKHIVPVLLEALGDSKKPDQKECALKMFSHFANEAPTEMAWCIDVALEGVLLLLTDIKKSVKDSAMEAAIAMCKTCGNRDIEPFIEEMIASIQTPTQMGETVEKLAGVVFVQPVMTPAIAVMAPVVTRGLKDRKEPTKRRSCVIIDNMVKLVPDPQELVPFLHLLVPLLEKAQEDISDPEARGVAERAFKTMHRAQEDAVIRSADPEAVSKLIRENGCEVSEVVDYLTGVALGLTNARNFESSLWEKLFTSLGLSSETAIAVKHLCFQATNAEEAQEDEDEEGEDLCNCVFTLGYGALTLLNNTRLHLKRGMNYGLLGPNDCGKTTLMRAINNEQVDGFPPKSELKTAFVEHGIGEAEPECDWLPVDYLMDEPVIKELYEAGTLTKEKMIEELEAVGFKKGDKLDMPLGQLSGGWKMKMGLVRAMLMEADILMMDEPTGHLDKFNCAWLTDYINSLKTGPKPVTVIATSHDTAFLEATTTHIIDFQNRKLKQYKGGLQNFVELVPEAKIYFEIKASKVKFTFPEPGYLEGVKRRGKVILKMGGVEFTYPTKTTPNLFGVGVAVSMLSRVAIVGPNGAGKSTMIKVLLGELKPTKGTIWKQQGSRIAYVSQHAFHHIENHLDKSATQYILERFAGGEDSESLENLANLGTTKETENQKVKQCYLKDGNLVECDTFYDENGEVQYQKKSLEKALKLEGIANRRKGKKEHEYEVKWVGYSIDFLTWCPRSILVDMGYKTQVQREDEKQAAMSGLQNKQLTTPGVEKHLADFGVEAEFATHNPLRALSAGQKVKIVLGAAMWQNPHILVIDEPTNYLDRDALGALTEAIEQWNGGVVVISHNLEFCSRVATEKWIMDAGHLRAEGGEYVDDAKIEDKTQDQDLTDSFGNTIKMNAKALDDKAKKKFIKDLEKQLKDNKKKQNLSEQEVWDLEDKLAELKA